MKSILKMVMALGLLCCAAWAAEAQAQAGKASPTATVSKNPTKLRIDIRILPEDEALRTAFTNIDSMLPPRMDQVARLSSQIRGAATDTVIQELKVDAADLIRSLGLEATDTIVNAVFDVRISQFHLATYETKGVVSRSPEGAYEIVEDTAAHSIDIFFAENHLRNLQRARAVIDAEIRRQLAVARKKEAKE